MRLITCFIMLLAACTPAFARNLGETVESLAFKDTWYLPRELKDLGDAKAYVFFFVREGCSAAEQYAASARQLEETFAPKGVSFVAVDACEADSTTQAAWFALRNELYFPMVKDWDGKCAATLGITTAPSVAVLDASHVLRYRGDINGLAAALEAILAGRAVGQAESRADGCPLNDAPPPAAPDNVTFSKDIAPLLQAKCVSCHRPGGQAPFELTTFDSVAAHANMIAEVVREGRMPPWYAHPDYGKFLNDRRLAPEEIATVRAWVASGKPQGDLQIVPAVEHVPDTEWHIPPDVIVTQRSPSAVPATGFVPYQYVFLPHVFEEDTYIDAIEIKPDHPKVLHHGNLAFSRGAFQVDEETDFLTGTVPGGIPSILKDGIAWKIPKGASLCMQLHLVTNGKLDSCTVRVGLHFARGTVDKLLYYHNFDAPKLEIAANERAHRVLKQFTLDDDASAIAMFSHMHLRGKAMTFAAAYPDGKRQWLMTVPNYSFDWQITYNIEPFRDHYPKGTTIECAAYWDNSRWNPYNPAPDKVVEHGPQTVDEMMNGFFVFTKDAEHLKLQIDPKTGFALKQVAQAAP